MTSHLYTFSPISLLLLPLSGVYWLLQRLHRFLYSSGALKTHRVGAPVIVVGNLTVGGTGKTPLVVWLCAYLQENGFRPGIISRGYKGQHRQVQRVDAISDPLQVGDEAVLLAAKTGVPVYTAANRVEAADNLLRQNDCDVLISDDGLQHYRLARDIEIVVVDGWRRFGNGFLLPAGPLRESSSRLESVDYVVCRGGQPQANEIPYNYRATGFTDLKTGEEHDLTCFDGKRAHAVAAIGNPAQFFSQLASLGVDLVGHTFPDHHSFVSNDLRFGDKLPVIMTEKDAVKCRIMSGDPALNLWSLVIEAQLPVTFGKDIVARLKKEYADG